MADLDERKFKAVIAYGNDLATNLRAGRGLLLSGPVGVGKSHAIAALTRLYVHKVVRSDHVFQTAPDLVDNLSEFSSNHDEYRDQPWMATYMNVPWLVINDLSKEYRAGKLGEQVAYKLGRLLRARCEKKLVTHVTTNADGNSLREEYGESIASLIAEMMTPIIVGGKDRRLAL